MYKTEVHYQGEVLTLTAQPDGKGWKVVLPDGSEHTIFQAEASEPTITLELPTGRAVLKFVRTPNGVEIHYRGRVYRFQSAAPTRQSDGHHPSAEGVLTAPMPGLITKVFVQQGERVEAGQRLLTLEAMKTEQTLRAPFAGVVARLYVREGDLVQENTLLIEVAEPEEHGSATET